jgi:hypothetical protein
MNDQARTQEDAGDDRAPPSGWDVLPDEHLPTPTYWPAALALAITLAFWGLISSAVIFLAGLALLAVSLFGWITQIRHEQRHTK